MRTPIAILLTALVAVVPTRGAAADAVPTETALDDAMAQGIALRRAGKDEAALGVFLDLEKRAPDSVRLLLHITTAALAAGKWPIAYEYMQKAIAHKDDGYFQRHKAGIENVEKAIAQHVGQFRAHGSPAGAEVRLNGEVVGTLPMGNAKALEVGSYVLEVSKPGFFPIRRPIAIANDGSITQEDVDLKEDRPFVTTSLMGQTALQPDVVGDSRPAAQPAWWHDRWVTWSLLGAGVLAGATSGVAFAIRESDASRWNSGACLDTVDVNQTRQSKCGSTRNDIDVAEGVGIAAAATAVVFGGAALVHWLSTKEPADARSRGAGSAAGTSCTPGLGGIVCAGSF